MPSAKNLIHGALCPKRKQSWDNRSTDPEDRLLLLPSQLSNHFTPLFPAEPVGGRLFDPEPDLITKMSEKGITKQPTSGLTIFKCSISIFRIWEKRRDTLKYIFDKSEVLSKHHQCLWGKSVYNKTQEKGIMRLRGSWTRTRRITNGKKKWYEIWYEHENGEKFTSCSPLQLPAIL